MFYAISQGYNWKKKMKNVFRSMSRVSNKRYHVNRWFICALVAPPALRLYHPDNSSGVALSLIFRFQK